MIRTYDALYNALEEDCLPLVVGVLHRIVWGGGRDRVAIKGAVIDGELHPSSLGEAGS